MVVQPINAEGLNISLLQFFGLGPKWTITCGNCHRTFKERIPMVDYPGIECPSCHAVNLINVVWVRLFDE